jgi:two-component system, chemotaxis family, chemotaxis protein CheY
MAFNILVADDSETMRAVIKKVVTMSGVPVGEFYEACHGLEALEHLKDAWVDVILSDINMPEMGGMDLLKAVMEDDVYKNIPLIFITTEASQARINEANELGVAGYVKKPFTPEQIKTILMEVLEKAYDLQIDETEMDMDMDFDDDDDMDF